MWIWRKMETIPWTWTEHKTKKEILELAQEERSLLTTLRQRRKKWLGHILRQDSPLKVIEGQIEGKKTPGRPTEMLIDWKITWIIHNYRKKPTIKLTGVNDQGPAYQTEHLDTILVAFVTSSHKYKMLLIVLHSYY